MLAASNEGPQGLRRFALALKRRTHVEFGNYLNYHLSVVNGDNERSDLARQLQRSYDEVGVGSEYDFFSRRRRTADFIDETARGIADRLAGDPADSTWYVVKGGTLATMATLATAPVDLLRLGEGAENAAEAYMSDDDRLSKWSRIIGGFAEDFLRVALTRSKATAKGPSSSSIDDVRRTSGRLTGTAERHGQRGTKGKKSADNASPTGTPRTRQGAHAAEQEGITGLVPMANLSRLQSRLDNSAEAILNSIPGLRIKWSSRGLTVYETPAGQLVGQHRAFAAFKKARKKTGTFSYPDWDSHHIIEVRHLEVLGLQRWFGSRDYLPAVLLPKKGHHRLRSFLGRADQKRSKALEITAAEMFSEHYARAYQVLGNYTGVASEKAISAELSRVSRIMLGFADP
jgi:hypothetical protein